MGGRQAYLCRKVQPGEIKPMPADIARIMAEADLIVASGIRRGFLSYPAGTKFDQDGRPIPVTTVANTLANPTESYPCLRAYLMHQSGATYREIAAAIKCSVGSIKPILEHGAAIYARQALVQEPREGQDTGTESKRAGDGKNAQGGAFKQADPTPRVGTLRPKPPSAGAKAARGSGERKYCPV